MIDTEALGEVYMILKQYIPTKDRQEAADNLMSSMVDFLSDQELKEFGGIDAALSRAYKEYVGGDDDELEEDDEKRVERVEEEGRGYEEVAIIDSLVLLTEVLVVVIA